MSRFLFLALFAMLSGCHRSNSPEDKSPLDISAYLKMKESLTKLCDADLSCSKKQDCVEINVDAECSSPLYWIASKKNKSFAEIEKRSEEMRAFTRKLEKQERAKCNACRLNTHKHPVASCSAGKCVADLGGEKK